jgi:tetratricopeptide (TPR) repeat protein
VAWLVGGIAMVTWLKGLNYPRAAVMAGQGVEHYRSAEFQASLAAFDRATKLAPDVPVYYTNKAKVYSIYPRFEQVRPERECSLQTEMDYQVCLAVGAYLNNQQALEQRPFYWRSRMALAESAFNLRRYDESARLHQEVVASIPTSWPVRERLGEVYVKTGQPGLALAPLEESLAITKDRGLSVPALVYLGRAYRDLGKLEQAVQPLERSLKLQPLGAYTHQTHLVLIEVYEALGRLEPAQNHRERLVEIYITEGHPNEAIKPLREFLARAGDEPRAARVYYLQGRAYRDLDDVEKSFESLERSLELGLSGNEGRIAHRLLAEIYSRLGRLTLVEKHREQLVQDYLAAGEPGAARQHLDLLAAAYLERGQPEKALEALQRSLALAGEGLAGELAPLVGKDATHLTDTFFLQGLAYLNVGEREKAAESLERSIRLNPKGRFAPLAQRALAEAYAQLGRSDLAKAHLKLLAEAYLGANRPEEALRVLQDLAAATPDAGSAEVSILLAVAYYDLRQPEKAIQFLKRSLELSPSREAARQAHITLSDVYASSGRDELAETHRRLAQELLRP